MSMQVHNKKNGWRDKKMTNDNAKVEKLISRATFRVTLNKKCYLCCVIERSDGTVKASMSKEWGFKIRKTTLLWDKILKEVLTKWELHWSTEI